MKALAVCFFIGIVATALLVTLGKGPVSSVASTQTSSAVVAPLPDLFKTTTLSDGNYEVFRRFTTGGTTVTCYAVFNDVKKNKTLFHTCTFTPANQPKT